MNTLPLGDHAELGPLEPWQAQEFLAHIDRARVSVDPWIPWATLTTDLDSATATLQRYADRLAQDTGRIHGIRLDGTLVGGVMFTRFDSASGVCEIGCWLERAGEGRGLVTRACRVLIDWAFQDRGMSRVEWWVASGNTRSIEVARRLGMTRDGVLRQRFPYRGVRQDSEVWSVLATEWPPAGDASGAGVRAELDRLMGVFTGAFTNTGGTRPDLGAIRDIFIPEGRIISNVGDEPVIHDIDGFIEPRRKMLTDGTLTEFSEWEVAERTEIFGSIAHRFSEYRKSGYHHGEWFEGSGHKTTQFVRTPAGWRMSSLAWDDAPASVSG
ncbi:GNAT family N-acetyltransferase [Streptomyces pristinaespiralis]|uniref:Acetyltransferase n=2 Tax=Streptomyces pristinaespiralis TaxID=38300 RepID=B5HEN4_STRE2|nr:GNAT family protein [Streptomyces pristinaespiralis]ALC24419.1 acetyltransferase [Streptomyces pristinaespiralis]EDY65296.2 acetyltransferase [Streptomyces pristinaespiralis ATCC 25486]QMU13229.1 GNAT family N-acetyltransferase [Streptomyces pristinaespiralis]